MGGGGITYFVMPAIFDSLVKNQGLTPHVAWRVAFIVPFIIITAIAMGILFTGEDCPAGKWENRHQMLDAVVVAPSSHNSIMEKSADSTTKSDSVKADPEAANTRTAIDTAEGEVVVAPTMKEGLAVLCSLQTLALAAPYACLPELFSFLRFYLMSERACALREE